MVQASTAERPVSAEQRGTGSGHSRLIRLFRIPKPGEQIPDDLRHLLEENDLLEEDADADDAASRSTPPAGLAAGLAFCLPAMGVIGLLYALLK